MHVKSLTWDSLGVKTHKQPSTSAFPTWFQPLQKLIKIFKNNGTNIETHWEHNIMNLWLDTCEEVLGKKTQHEECIFPDTIHRIEKKRRKLH
jgi:flagellar biosynthesis/type III secretory pathway protein FliH